MKGPLQRGMDTLLKAVLGRLNMGERGRHLLQGASGVFGSKVISLGLMLLISLLLSRLLGAEEFGRYAYALSWAQLLLVVVLLGLDRYVVREVAVLVTRGDLALLRGVLQRSSQGVLLASILIAAGFAATFPLLFQQNTAVDGPMVHATQIAMLLLPVLAFVKLRQSLLLGLDRAAISHIGELVAIPSLFLLAVVGWWLLPLGEITSQITLGLQIAATTITLLWLWHISGRYLPEGIRGVRPRYQTARWVRQSLPMLAVASIQVINARVDVLMVGSMLGADDAGVYSIANRGASVGLMVYFAVNAAIAPVAASLHEKGEYSQLQQVLGRAARMGMLATLPISGVLVAFAPFIMGLFGHEFVVGAVPLMILASGIFASLLFGNGSTVLLMSDREVLAAVAVGISAAVNAGLNLLLIPRLGMTGAAVALISGQFMALGGAAFMVWRTMGLNTTVFYWKKRATPEAD